MEKILLPQTELEISRIALGTDSYGLVLNEEESFSMLDFYTFKGGNVIDTALVYSDWAEGEKSRSEKLIGRWLEKRGRRDEVIISTKGGYPPFNNMESARLSREDIKGDLEKSLKNLRTDYVDIYWLHRDCEIFSTEEIMDTLDSIVKSGKIRYFGMSNWRSERIKEANEYAYRNSLNMIKASQIQYSCAKSIKENCDKTLVLMDDGQYEFYKKSKMPVFAFASQAKGFFSKLSELGAEKVSGKARLRYMCDENFRRFEVVKKISENYSVPVSRVSLSALTSNKDFITIPIVGCKNITQLEDSIKSLELKLSMEELKEIFIIQ